MKNAILHITNGNNIGGTDVCTVFMRGEDLAINYLRDMEFSTPELKALPKIEFLLHYIIKVGIEAWAWPHNIEGEPPEDCFFHMEALMFNARLQKEGLLPNTNHGLERET